MTDEEALALVGAALESVLLGDLQELVFRQVWNGKSYAEIASGEGYSPEYIKRVGAALWRSLSHALGEKVTKSNVRSLLRRYAAQADRLPAQKPGDTTSTTNLESNDLKWKVSRCCWGDVIDTSRFYGRTAELNLLQQWVISDRCQLLALFGMGGVGKTALAAKLAHQIQDAFEFVIWRSLRHAPLLDDLLSELILFLSHQKDTLIAANPDHQIAHLMRYLRDHRCLLILDHGESILQKEARLGVYRLGYESYGELLRQISQGTHQSCLILTSRERFWEVSQYAGDLQLTRSLQVNGLLLSDAQVFLSACGLNDSESIQQDLIRRYQGNPLALKIALSSIRDLFDQNIATFLDQDAIVFNGVRYLFDQQFDRLSSLERQVMYWLCINREPVVPSDLQTDIFPPISMPHLLEALESLVGRSLIERSRNGFSQQPVLMEYVADHLIEHIRAELLGKWESQECFLQTYALLKAEGKEYVREAQVRLLLKPIADWLLLRFGSLANCQTQLSDALKHLRSQSSGRGYGGGNIFNLLRQLEVDLTGWDFSNLAVWQANLSGINLHQVNFASGDLSKSVFTQTCGGIVAIAFHPDGTRMATGDTEGQIHLWQVSDGRLLQRWKAHPAWASTIAFSPDGDMLASGGLGDAVKLWQISTRQCLKTLSGHKDQIWSICFSPDGQQLAVADYSPTVRVWNVQTGRCDLIFAGHTQSVWAVAYVRSQFFAQDPDDLILLSGSLDHTIKFWSLNTGACLYTLKHGHQIKSLAVSPDGTLLASGSVDAAIRLWNLHTGEALAPLHGHTDQAWCVVFSPDQNALEHPYPLLITGSFDQTIRCWDVTTGNCLQTLQGHTNPIWAIAASPNGKILASGGFDHAIRLWELDTGRCLRVLQGYALVVWTIAYATTTASTQFLLASGGSDHLVRLWDANTGKPLKVLRGHQSQVWSVAFHPLPPSPLGQGGSEGLLASGSLDHTVKLWEVHNGRCLRTLREHDDWVSSVAFSPNGEFLVSGSTDHTVRVWDIETGDCIRVLTHTSQIWSVAVTLDSQMVISGCLDRTIRIWAVNTGECLNVLAGHGHMVWAIALSPDGCTLASGSLDNTVKLWDLETGVCLHTLAGHTNQVVAVAFSPDGQTIASGATDQRVKLWDTQTGECRETLSKHRNMVRSLAFRPTGNQFASASADATIRLWDCETWQPLQVLRSDRPYEGMNITDAIGLTEAQQESLVHLGAVAY